MKVKTLLKKFNISISGDLQKDDIIDGWFIDKHNERGDLYLNFTVKGKEGVFYYTNIRMDNLTKSTLHDAYTCLLNKEYILIEDHMSIGLKKSFMVARLTCSLAK